MIWLQDYPQTEEGIDKIEAQIKSIIWRYRQNEDAYLENDQAFKLKSVDYRSEGSVEDDID